MIYESTRKMSVKEQEVYDLGYLNGKEAALSGPQPDPITGLVPCGYCSGNRETHEVMPSDPVTIWTIKPYRKQLSFINCNWGCNDYVVDINYCPMCGRNLTASPLSGAIVPGMGEMAPSGDEGADKDYADK